MTNCGCFSDGSNREDKAHINGDFETHADLVILYAVSWKAPDGGGILKS